MSETVNGEHAPHGVTLRSVLETACSEHKCSLKDLTVLAAQNDPYRLDTPSKHRDAEWVARQIERAFQPHQRVHSRGVHYAVVVQGDVRKPNGQIYRNTDSDDEWLDDALKAARWLGYVPFERISDNRNAEPVIFRANDPIGSLFTHLSAGVEVGQVAFDLGPIHIAEPTGRLYGFRPPAALRPGDLRREEFARRRTAAHRAAMQGRFVSRRRRAQRDAYL